MRWVIYKNDMSYENDNIGYSLGIAKVENSLTSYPWNRNG